uniref:Uncharacterized protein n=1 Tax=Acrobeloides nanus TaxID=290746 RepID=A0A914EFU8_9BILA
MACNVKRGSRSSCLDVSLATGWDYRTFQIYYTSSVKIGKTFYNIQHPQSTQAPQNYSPPTGPDSWPSTASVLETPERRKWKDSNGGRLSVDSGLEISDLFHSPPFQADAQQVTKNESESPILKTPSTTFRNNYSTCNVHISASPMRSFHVKGSMDSPIRRLPLSSTPLKLSNPEKAIGIRFSGEELAMTSTPKPLAMIQAKATNRFLELPPSRNDFIMPEISRRSSLSSSNSSIEVARGAGRDSMLNISNDIDMMVMIETPSKSLRNNPEDSSNFLNDLSPIPRASPLKGRLSVVPLADGFIPEQPSGILEASMFDILDPLNENLVPAQMARSTTNPYQCSHVLNKKRISSRSPIKKARISSPSKLIMEMDKNS